MEEILNEILTILSLLCFTKSFFYIKKNDRNIIAIFFYGLFLTYQLLPYLFKFIILGNLSNYIEILIQIGAMVILQLLLYKLAIAEKPDFKDNATMILNYNNNVKKLEKIVYKYLLLEVFFQVSIIGLIPVFNSANYIFVETASFICFIIGVRYITIIKKIILAYNKHKYIFNKWKQFFIWGCVANVCNTFIYNFSYFFTLSSEGNLLINIVKILLYISLIIEILIFGITLFKKEELFL